jgi:hypothetical protein
MPFKSESQRRFMFAKHPAIARRWVSEGKGNVVVAGNKITPKPGTSFANNKPIGSAGQPVDDDVKSDAISRRLTKISQDKAKGKK